MLAYLYLAIAIVAEVAGTMCMKYSEGFTKWQFAVGMGLCYMCSLYSVSLTLKYLDLGTTYAIWAGLGTALVAIIGFVYFKESVTWIKVLSIAIIILGVIGLNLSAKVE